MGQNRINGVGISLCFLLGLFRYTVAFVHLWEKPCEPRAFIHLYFQPPTVTQSANQELVVEGEGGQCLCGIEKKIFPWLIQINTLRDISSPLVHCQSTVKHQWSDLLERQPLDTCITEHERSRHSSSSSNWRNWIQEVKWIQEHGNPWGVSLFPTVRFNLRFSELTAKEDLLLITKLFNWINFTLTCYNYWPKIVSDILLSSEELTNVQHGHRSAGLCIAGEVYNHGD